MLIFVSYSHLDFDDFGRVDSFQNQLSDPVAFLDLEINVGEVEPAKTQHQKIGGYSEKHNGKASRLECTGKSKIESSLH